jgi:hypothetical protein
MVQQVALGSLAELPRLREALGVAGRAGQARIHTHRASGCIPGQVAKLRFTPDKTGTYPFLCDVFCGDGHETMSGKLIVRW